MEVVRYHNGRPRTRTTTQKESTMCPRVWSSARVRADVCSFCGRFEGSTFLVTAVLENGAGGGAGSGAGGDGGSDSAMASYYRCSHQCI